MTFTILKSHQATVALLSAALEQNAAYISAFGYPSGIICPHCQKEVFANATVLEALSQAPPGTGLAHDWCNEISKLTAALNESEKQRPVEVHITEMPKRVNGVDHSEHQPEGT